MKKAFDEIRKSLHIVDLVIEVGDARAPFSSLNSMLDGIIGDRMRLLVFSKKDLADEKRIAAALGYFRSRSIEALALDFKDRGDIRFLLKNLSGIKSVKAAKYERYNLAAPPLRALIVGIPNVGKSTLINSLVGKSKAKVANRPGETKAQQLIKLGDRLELFDTPGVLQPDYDDKKAIMHLAWLGSLRDEAVPLEDVYESLAVFLLKEYPSELNAYYGISATEKTTPDNLFALIAAARHFILPGSKPDIDRAKTAFLKEFRAGALVRCVIDDVSA